MVWSIEHGLERTVCETKFCDLEVAKSSFCGSQTNQTGENAETTSGRKDFLRDHGNIKETMTTIQTEVTTTGKKQGNDIFKEQQHYSQYGPLIPDQNQE